MAQEDDDALPPLEGGCICGRVRYRVTEPQVVLICHCRNCQQRTGSAYNLSMLVLRKDFEVLSGETLTCELPGGSGALHRQHVCAHGFTRTHTEMLAHPDVINVRPGTLDDPSVAKPIAQIWTSLAHPCHRAGRADVRREPDGRRGARAVMARRSLRLSG